MNKFIFVFNSVFLATNFLAATPMNEVLNEPIMRSTCQCKNCRCTPDHHCGCQVPHNDFSEE